MSILFVSSNLSNSLNGGWQCSKRNYDSICALLGENNVETTLLKPFSLKNQNIYSKLLNIVFSLYRTLILRINGSSVLLEKELITKINSKKINTVFIDSSLNGTLAKQIKRKTQAKVISFFHNCEYIFVKNQVKKGSLSCIPRIYSCYYNEKLTIKYSDKVIVLNDRDKNLLKSIYRTTLNPEIIPISLKDQFSLGRNTTNNEKTAKTQLLFVGSNFYANSSGILWFVEHVLPFVNVQLIIVGKDMDKLNLAPNDNITIYSNVESITDFYINADVVIAPIFTGGGMKVKIAEALMYGKLIMATNEGSEGYAECQTIIKCNTAAEFISSINKCKPLKFYMESRELFSSTYSFSSTLNMFNNVLN